MAFATCIADDIIYRASAHKPVSCLHMNNSADTDKMSSMLLDVKKRQTEEEALFTQNVFSCTDTGENFVLRDASHLKKHDLSVLMGEFIEILFGITEFNRIQLNGHNARSKRYVRVLADALAKKTHYQNILTPAYIENLELSAPMHDVGKVGIPNTLISKTGPLTPEEFEIMKQHTVYGSMIIEALRHKWRGQGWTFLSLAQEIAYGHHERFDGSGYPLGLKGRDIPISARIMAAADIYDALRSQRAYKPAMSHEKTMGIMLSTMYSQLDPEIMDAFLAEEEIIKNLFPEEIHMDVI